MQEAARGGDLVKVTRLLDQGIDVNEVNMVNTTTRISSERFVRC